jgi:chromosomal replication initiation ATPase DnaA
MNNPIQFPLEFSEYTSFAKDDFIISDANSNAFNYIQNWITEEQAYNKFLILYGPKNSGKTHLTHIFSNATEAKFIKTKDLFTKHPSEIVLDKNFLILEDLETLSDCETIIFHLLNEIAAHSCRILITSQVSPSALLFKLPDLKSRIKALPFVSINQPDDRLIRTLLTKRFADKQIRVSSEIINYLATHIERSFIEINNVINYIDKKSIIEKRNITLSLVKEVLNYIEAVKA